MTARLLSLLVVVFLLAAVLTTYPLGLHLARAVPGDIGDPLLNAWILAWDAHALLTDPLHLFDANIFYPLPNTLAYSEHMLSTACLVMPLQIITGEPLVAHNLSLLFSFVLAGLGMYLLVLRWTHRHGAAIVAATVFAFAPYRLAAISHLQLLTVGWLPFSLLALDWLLDKGRYHRDGKRPAGRGRSDDRQHTRWWTPALLFVLFTILQVMSSWYLAVFSAVVLGIYTASWLIFTTGQRIAIRRGTEARPTGTRSLLPLAASALLVAALTLLMALPYLGMLTQLQAARPPELVASLAARPTDFLAAAPSSRFLGPLTQPLRERPGFTEENTLYVGGVALLLALAGLALSWRGPCHRTPAETDDRWRLAALATILLLSTVLTLSGPYLALVRVFPLMSVVRVPSRWIIPATFAIAALAGYGAACLQTRLHDHLSGRRSPTDRNHRRTEGRLPPAVYRYAPPALVCLLSLLVVAESYSAPLPLALVGTMADLPPVYPAMRQHAAITSSATWAAIELPMHVAPAPEYPETKRMIASRLGWWGLVNGYSGFTPERQMALAGQMAGFPSQGAMAALRELGVTGVRYLIVHPNESPLDGERWHGQDRWQVERQTTLLPLGQFGADDLYLINPYGDSLVTDPSIATDPYWSAHAPHQVMFRFELPSAGSQVQLLAYVLEPAMSDGRAALAGSPSTDLTRLTLFWRANARPNTSYTVFVHSLNADGQMVGQSDSPPVSNNYPTTAWLPGEIVQDSHLVPTGHRYVVGLYEPTTGTRLPAFADDGTRLGDDAVPLSVPAFDLDGP